MLVDRIHTGGDIVERNRKLTYLPFSSGKGSIPNLGITLKK
jgi:hypothetical protein